MPTGVVKARPTGKNGTQHRGLQRPAPGAAAPDVSSCDTRERFLNGELRRQCRSAHKATVIPSSAVRLRSLLNIAAGAAQEVAEC